MMRQMNPESLKGMASLLQQYGRNGDTILAHINPREAMLLDRVSGGGSMNPMTGMPEFFPADDDQEGPSEEGDDDTFSDQDEVGEPGEQQTDIGTGVGEPGETGYGGDERGDPYGGQDPSLGPVGEDSADVMSRGLGSLIDQAMPDKPGILEVLTAPIETIVSALTFGLVDPEFTGKDVLGVPGMTSTDLSRGMAGLQGPQPVGVEIGFSPIGTVGIDRSGVSAYGGSLTNTLTDLFSSGLKESTAVDLAKKNPDLANQLANKKLSVAADKAVANVSPISSPNPRGYSYSSPLATPDTKPSIFGGTPPSFYSDPPPPSNVQTQAPAPTEEIDRSNVGVTLGVNPVGVNLNRGGVGVNLNRGGVGVSLPGLAQGGPVSLDALYNNVRARRGPITGGQRSGGGIMSLR